MRIVESLLPAMAVAAGLMVAPALALDGSKSGDKISAATPVTPREAFRSGAHWLKAGEKAKAVHSLEYAAEKGHALAQWKLGRMYAEGDGVTQNDLKAFEYFRRIADEHALCNKQIVQPVSYARQTAVPVPHQRITQELQPAYCNVRDSYLQPVRLRQPVELSLLARVFR